jgi:hypothetical protein
LETLARRLAAAVPDGTHAHTRERGHGVRLQTNKVVDQRPDSGIARMSKLRKRNLVRLEQALQRLGTELVHRRLTVARSDETENATSSQSAGELSAGSRNLGGMDEDERERLKRLEEAQAEAEQERRDDDEAPAFDPQTGGPGLTGLTPPD